MHSNISESIVAVICPTHEIKRSFRDFRVLGWPRGWFTHVLQKYEFATSFSRSIISH